MVEIREIIQISEYRFQSTIKKAFKLCNFILHKFEGSYKLIYSYNFFLIS